MTKQGLHKIKALRQWYVTGRVLVYLLWAVGIALAIATLLFYGFKVFTPLLLPLLLMVFVILLFIFRPWGITYGGICAYLDKKYPELEESSALITKDEPQLNLLEQLQQQKVSAQLNAGPVFQRVFFKGWLYALALINVTTAVNFYLGKGEFFTYTQVYDCNPIIQPPTAQVAEQVLPQIASVNVLLSPPAYTHKPGRNQDRFTINIEDGSLAKWVITTNISVKNVKLLFNDKEVTALRTGNGKVWTGSKRLNQPGFYQVWVDGKLSDLYQIQIIKDLPPVVHIRAPKQYTYIDAGEAQQITINAAVNDDYGVSAAEIFATVAKGSGEGVKFKEYRLSFAKRVNGDKRYQLQKSISLPALNMEPGDELYFYIQATDTHRQQSRTDVYTVTIQDTAQLLSMDGMLTGVDQKPAFFRSQRQIILDTEKLLKEKDTISAVIFNNRSNDLGVDQKILRLRYGKFLGEESEEGHGGEVDDEIADPNNFGNAELLHDKYTDKHDNAEDAQFFDPVIKKQLKATLTEMWKAELQLRLHKPQAALPFEYKALRLLKDLQQKSRVYVAKTNYNPPPLKPEKRLSGELDKVGMPVNKQNIKQAVAPYADLQKATSVLMRLRQTSKLSADDKQVLQLASQQLSRHASAQPGIYLPALGALRRLINGSVVKQDIALVEKAIQRALVAPAKTPAPANTANDGGLSYEYYKNLSH